VGIPRVTVAFSSWRGLFLIGGKDSPGVRPADGFPVAVDAAGVIGVKASGCAMLARCANANETASRPEERTLHVNQPNGWTPILGKCCERALQELLRDSPMFERLPTQASGFTIAIVFPPPRQYP